MKGKGKVAKGGKAGKPAPAVKPKSKKDVVVEPPSDDVDNMDFDDGFDIDEDVEFGSEDGGSDDPMAAGDDFDSDLDSDDDGLTREERKKLARKAAKEAKKARSKWNGDKGWNELEVCSAACAAVAGASRGRTPN